MFRIGEFSKINQITVRTLRHYEEMGLLAPVEIDRFTGYRYYSVEQLDLIDRILTFKRMGFSLTEIKVFLEKGIAEDDIERKRSQLAREKTGIDASLRELASYQNKLRGELVMEQVNIKKLPGVLSISYRTILRGYGDLMDLMPNKIGPEMQRMGLTCLAPEYCFNRYHDGEYRETNIDVEICEAIVARGGESNFLNYVEFAEVPEAACIYHRGPYASLGQSYAAIFKWIEENGYECTEIARESFIDGIWNKDDEKDWLTEIQVPVKKK